MDNLIISFISLLVGFFCGCTSIGGILLIPAIVIFSNLNLHEAMATSLFSFALMAMLGTFLHYRKRTIVWNDAFAICCSAAISSIVGAYVNPYVNTYILNIILACLILFSGISILLPQKNSFFADIMELSRKRFVFLFILGILVGFMAGLTGIGGPVLSVPIMVSIGFSPIASIAVSQPLQVIAGASGSIINIFNGYINYSMAIWITVLEFIGFYFGIVLAYKLNAKVLKYLICLLCVITGVYMIVR